MTRLIPQAGPKRPQPSMKMSCVDLLELIMSLNQKVDAAVSERFDILGRRLAGVNPPS